MSSKPLDVEVINNRERPLSTDINTASSYASAWVRYLLRQINRVNGGSALDYLSTDVGGVIGDSLKVREANPASMSVVVTKGVGFVPVALNPSVDDNIGAALSPGVTGLSDLDPWRPIVLNDDHTFVVPDNTSGSVRYDIVEVTIPRRLTDATLRAVLDPATGVFNPVNVPKTLTWAADGSTEVNTSGGNSTAALAYKLGTPGGGPPSPSAGYFPLAVIRVDSGATSLPSTSLTAPYNVMLDQRGQILGPSGMAPFAVELDSPAGTDNPASDVRAMLPPSWWVSTAWEDVDIGLFSTWYIYLGGPSLPQALLGLSASVKMPGSALNPIVLNIVSAEKVTVDSTLQGKLASGAWFKPFQSAALGQEVWAIRVMAQRYSGGSWAQPGVEYTLCLSGVLFSGETT